MFWKIEENFDLVLGIFLFYFPLFLTQVKGKTEPKPEKNKPENSGISSSAGSPADSSAGSPAGSSAGSPAGSPVGAPAGSSDANLEYGKYTF